MTTVCVTGANGLIGSNLCRLLSNEGYKIQAIDKKFSPFLSEVDVQTHSLDLNSSPQLPNSDIIIHLAAHSQVQPVVENPEMSVENIAMTRCVLDEATRMDAFVINASSRDVYGSKVKPLENEITADVPNEYAASKLGAEALTNAYTQTKGVSATSIRLANVYGRMDLNRRLIPIFISLAASGEELPVYGDGKLLDFIHVDDVCEAINRVINRQALADGEVFNIGSGAGVTLPEIADHIVRLVDDCPGWSIKSDRDGDVSRYVSNISKAKATLGFKPEITIEQGLEEVVDWYLNHPEHMDSIRSGM